MKAIYCPRHPAGFMITGPIRNKNNFRKAAGSITVEASLAVPVLLFAAAAFLFLFLMPCTELKLQTAMQKGLNRYIVIAGIGKELDTDLTELEEGIAGSTLRTLAVGELVLAEYGRQLREQEEENILLKKNGIFMTVEERESHGGTYLLLTADYRWNITIFPSVKWMPYVRQTAIASLWEGREYEALEETEEYVYVAEYGAVYHLYPDCRYLDITIYPLAEGELEYSRNQSGGKYYPCEYCSDNTEVSAYYVTAYGTAYHFDIGCSRITRSVSKVPRQAVSLPECAVCAGREAE